MPNIKALIIILSALTLSFLLIGCGILPSPEAEPEEPETVEEGTLPEWLLSEHRTADREDEEPLKPKEPEEEDADEEETADSESVVEAAEPEPVEEPATQQETNDGHQIEAETEEPVAEENDDPEPREVSNRSWEQGNYSGEWLDGQPHGQGTFKHPDGGTLTGKWDAGEPTGRHTLTKNGSTETINFDNGAAGDPWWDSPGSGNGSDFFN